MLYTTLRIATYVFGPELTVLAVVVGVVAGRTGKLASPRTCEATVGFDERRHMLVRCKEPATLLFLPDRPPPPNQPPLVWVALCQKCFLSMRCEGDVTP